MSRSGRILAIAATLVVLVIAFVVLSPSDDDDPATVATQTQTQPAQTTPAGTAPAPPPPQQPKFAKVVVRDGRPVGGVERIEVDKDSRVRIEVSSPDTSDEVHLHGYDLRRDLDAGGRVRFVFTAKTDGIYEIELEGAHVPIAELRVSP